MKITNKSNLPEPVYQAILNDQYDPGESDVTTTQLIDPVQVTTLKRRFKDKLEEDASERVWSLLGSCMHVIFERAADAKAITEKRFYADVLGWKVGGQIDSLKDGVLTDYKVTSVWSYIFGDHKDYEAQGNVNRWILHKNGVQVDGLENVLVLRDWIKSKAGDGKYPPIQIVKIPLPLWPLGSAGKFVEDKVRMLQEADKMDAEALAQAYPCSPLERWPDKKKGGYNRCKGYCPVRNFCTMRNSP